MSAAEKLRVLDETFKASKNQREQADYLYRMAAVFPEIIAVVEAAWILQAYATEPQDVWDEEMTQPTQVVKMRSALAALDTKL